MKSVYVPWLHMHQPMVWHNGRLISNLQKMLESNDSKESWEAKLMARAYKNPAKYVLELSEKGFKPKIMLDFSGILLESLNDMKNILEKTYVDGEKIGDIIKLYKNVMDKYPDAIEFAGTAYSHCYFPATPEDDWDMQIKEWKNVFKKLFGQKNLQRIKGFWLPEMGVPGGKKLETLIQILKENGYEWIILPVEALKGEKQLGFEQRVTITSQPHIIQSNGEKIPVIFKVKYDFIDQQAGCDAGGVYDKAVLASKIFSYTSKKPALVVPASDGENGNVMMNEFFRSTFVPFFTSKTDENVESMCVTEFLQKYYAKNGKIDVSSIVEISDEGSSWIGGHQNWLVGDKRLEMKAKVDQLSKEFHDLKQKSDIAKKSLLLAETSCYVYWGIDYWFDQGEEMIKYAKTNFKKQ
ncbi:MAG: glycoside hydrolase [Candidatus Aenigmatarchaeota archaeon]|nr:glycoside hydrolase [Candidatus Aenigmarchaeota archaeon]